jgi:hypothetical protein
MIPGVFPNEFSKNDRQFTAVFYNLLPYSIDFYGVDFYGRRLQYTRELETGNKRKETTTFTIPWVFKNSKDKPRLHAYAGTTNGSVFKGENFGAKEGSKIHVTINSHGKIILVFKKRG